MYDMSNEAVEIVDVDDMIAEELKGCNECVSLVLDPESFIQAESNDQFIAECMTKLEDLLAA